MSAPAWEFAALGTRWRIFHSGGLSAAAVAQVAVGVERDEQRWSRFRDDSEVSRLTRRAGRPVEVSPETFELLAVCAEWVQRTGGVFQPLVGRALERWGYGRSIAERPPTAARAPRPAPVTGLIALDPDRLRVTLPAGTSLDLGGIGKAWIAQRAAALLAALAVDEHLLIDAGGDLLAVRGEHTAGVAALDGEWVRLRAGEAMATSGYSQRQWVTGDGRRAHHLIDPLTGAPGPLVHATVVARDAVAADVTAKVLALRPQALHDSCEAALLVGEDGVERNAGWQRLRHAPPPARTVRQ